MAPSKRRKTSTAQEPASGNATQGVRTRHSASARGDVPDAPDADLDAEPEVLLCPITRAVFRDPVMVVPAPLIRCRGGRPSASDSASAPSIRLSSHVREGEREHDDREEDDARRARATRRRARGGGRV